MLRLLAAIMGPIFAKEMVEIARRKRYYFNRVFYGSVLLFVTFIVWTVYEDQLRWGNTRLIEVMAEMASALFLTVSGVQFGAVFLFVPVFLCGVISGEREDRTLELLLTTDLKDREIVLGKLFSRLVVLVLLILCALPISALITLFGGVDPAAQWRILAATLVAMIYAGAHAIYFSAVSKSPMGALVRTYWWMGLWLFGLPPALIIPVAANTPSPFHPLAQFCLGTITLINPIGPFVAAMIGQASNPLAVFLESWLFPLTFVVPLSWSGFLIWRAVKRLRLPPTALARLLGRVPAVRAVRDVVERIHQSRAARRRRKAECTPLGGAVQNPLWLRSRLARVYDREGHVSRIQWGGYAVAAFFLMLLAITVPRDIDDEEMTMAFLAPIWIGIAALTAIVAGTSLVGDRRRGFLELVLTTPLEPREMVDGSILAIWEHVRRVYWLPLAVGSLFALVGASPWIGVWCSLVTGLLACSVMLVTGLACSLTARTVATALVPTFVFPAVVCVGIAFLIPIFEEGAGPALWILCVVFLIGAWAWSRSSSSAAAVGCHFLAMHIFLTALATCWTWDGRDDEFPIVCMHPGFWMMALLDDNPQHWFWQSPLFLPWSAWPGALLCYWAALAGYVIWARWWLIRHFDRLVDRVHVEPETLRLFARPVVLPPVSAGATHAHPTSGRVAWPVIIHQPGESRQRDAP
jgi:ABC-type transport system involved in multi-copper enzyme maturation permease subunit